MRHSLTLWSQTSLLGFASRKASRVYAVIKIASLVNLSVGSCPDGRFPFVLPMLFCYMDCNELSIEQLQFWMMLCDDALLWTWTSPSPVMLLSSVWQTWPQSLNSACSICFVVSAGTAGCIIIVKVASGVGVPSTCWAFLHWPNAAVRPSKLECLCQQSALPNGAAKYTAYKTKTKRTELL